MKFASRVYLAAGIIGLIEIVPMYFMESLLGRMYPPEFTHPEIYYGFVGVTLAWQVLFLMLARDPVRYRALMLPTMLEKAVYVVAASVLLAQDRMAPGLMGPVFVDAILGTLFVISYVRTAPKTGTQES